MNTFIDKTTLWVFIFRFATLIEIHQYNVDFERVWKHFIPACPSEYTFSRVILDCCKYVWLRVSWKWKTRSNSLLKFRTIQQNHLTI